MLRLFLALILAQPVLTPPDPHRPFPLMVGDQAPPLDVQWYRPANADNLIRHGTPYVVEFWSTWCGPCIENFPVLSETQRKYEGRLTVVGVSVWEPRPEEVYPFVEKQGDRMAYAVAADSVPPPPLDVDNPSDWAKENGAAAKAWLKASGWSWDGIPVAFIVNEQGRIAWAGHPRMMQEPLAAVVEGRWNLEAFLPEYRADRAFSTAARVIYARRRAAWQRGDHAAVLSATDELLALGPRASRYSGSRFHYLLAVMNEPEKAYAYAREAMAGGGPADGNSDALNEIAATIITPDRTPAREELDVALAASKRAATLSPAEVYTLTTLAEVHAARGEFTDAAAAQRRAIDAAPALRKPDLLPKLQKYETAAKR